MSKVERFTRVLHVEFLIHPLYEIATGKHTGYFRHETLDGAYGHAGRVLLHFLDDALDFLVDDLVWRLFDARLLYLNPIG